MSTLLGFVLLPILLMMALGGCENSQRTAKPDSLSALPPLTTGIVIRAGQCSAKAFKNGSGVYVGQDNDTISGLSVNCSAATSNKANYDNYLTGIGGYGQYCVATVAALNKVGAKIVPDAVTGNPDHCLLAGKASKIAGKLTRYP